MLNLLTLALVKDESFVEIWRRMQHNWEALSIFPHELFGQELSSLAEAGVLTPIGAFAIARCRNVLRDFS